MEAPESVETTQSAEFTFIDVGIPSAQQKRRNANKARSHAMTAVRRKQRVQRGQEGSLDASLDKRRAEEHIESLSSRDAVQARSSRPSQNSCLPGALWDLSMTKNLKLQSLSISTVVEMSFDALNGYKGQITSNMHKLIHHSKFDHLILFDDTNQ